MQQAWAKQGSTSHSTQDRYYVEASEVQSPCTPQAAQHQGPVTQPQRTVTHPPYTRRPQVKVARTGRVLSLTRPQRMFAQDRSTVQEGFAGDVIGLTNPGAFAIGDTIYSGKAGRQAGMQHMVRSSEACWETAQWCLLFWLGEAHELGF